MAEKCMWCSAEYETVYHVPDEVWKEVSGKEDGSGLICMSCFDDEALHQGKDIWWEAGIGNYPTNKRIKALEGVVDSIRGGVELVESGVEQDLYKHHFFMDVKEALSKLEEV